MDENQAQKRFSDFAKEHVPLDGAKLKIDTILNKEIEILAAKIHPSKYTGVGKSTSCLTLQFRLNGEKYVAFTGSGVLAEQVQSYEKEIPFLTTIKKIDKYYTFT